MAIWYGETYHKELELRLIKSREPALALFTSNTADALEERWDGGNDRKMRRTKAIFRSFIQNANESSHEDTPAQVF